MTRLDAVPGPAEMEGAPDCDGPRAMLLESREVPLGGVRAMQVHRSLPQRDLPMIGAWCFLDRFGPQVTTMRVEPHPHVGLQTVTWPFTGTVRHRDTIGSDVLIARGQLNLMTSGAGIAHSEYSTGDGPTELDALQLWVALPESRRHGGPAFEQYAQLPEVEIPGIPPTDEAGGQDAASGQGAAGGQEPGPSAYGMVVMGEFAGVRSPASAYTPLAGVELRIPAGAHVRLPMHADWEYGLVGIDGTLTVRTGGVAVRHGAVLAGETNDADGADASAAASVDLSPQHLLYTGIGRDGLDVSSAEGATVFVLGGEPFEDDIVMWWNFVARSHDEVVAAREAWQANTDRFGHVVGHGDERIPAPPMPNLRLTRRRRRI